MNPNTELEGNLKKGETRLNLSIAMRAIVVFVAGFVCFSACSAMQLPEHIYKRPSDGLYRDTAVGLFRFSSPEYAPRSGYSAATMLYKELLERGLSNVAAEFDVQDIRLDSIMEIAEKKNYELIITGEVSYYISGGELQESRVDEEIRVIDVPTRETVWYAETVEIGTPVYSADYIFFSTEQKGAPSPAVLMRRNARKFCNMLLSISEQEGDIAKDMKFVREGYNYLVNKEYDKAKSSFEKALDINPHNPHALFNLGLVHEKQGNTQEAIKTYQTVIEQNTDIKAEESKDSIKIGHGLVDLARERLRNLESKTVPAD